MTKTKENSKTLTLTGTGNLDKFDPDVAKRLITNVDYLARLQLMTSNSGKVKEKMFDCDHFAFIKSKDNLIDLGENVDIFVIHWRPFALDVNTTPPITVYDPKFDSEGNSTGEFARIENDSTVKDSGCMVGIDFLVYIPKIKEYATIFFGSKSMRREAPEMMKRLKMPATLSSKLIKTEKYTWTTTNVGDCNTPLEVPEQNKLDKILDSFVNTKEEEREKADVKTKNR